MKNLEIQEYNRFRQSVTFDAAARAEITLTAPQGVSYLIDRMAVRASAGTPDLFVYVGPESNENLVDGSSSGELDFADNNSPVLVRPGETIRFVWTGGNVGATASVNAQYRILAYTDVTKSYSVPAPLEPETKIPFRRRRITAGYGGGW